MIVEEIAIRRVSRSRQPSARTPTVITIRVRLLAIKRRWRDKLTDCFGPLPARLASPSSPWRNVAKTRPLRLHVVPRGVELRAILIHARYRAGSLHGRRSHEESNSTGCAGFSDCEPNGLPRLPQRRRLVQSGRRLCSGDAAGLPAWRTASHDDDPQLAPDSAGADRSRASQLERLNCVIHYPAATCPSAAGTLHREKRASGQDAFSRWMR
jgi:hypothetical protein